MMNNFAFALIKLYLLGDYEIAYSLGNKVYLAGSSNFNTAPHQAGHPILG